MIVDSKSLSIVCPAYNEELVLPLFHRELSAVLADMPTFREVEIIFVDDGSRDGTLRVLRELSIRDPRVRYVSFSRNFGHQAALTAGMEASRGDVIVSMDSDLQHPPCLIPTLVEHWQAGNEVVITVRDDTCKQSLMSTLLSRTFYSVAGRVTDTEIRSAAADFRLMSRKAVNALLQMGECHRFLRGMVQWVGFPTAEVHFVAAARAAGTSKYDLRRKFRLAFDGIFSFSKAFLRAPFTVGAVCAMIGVLAWCRAFLGLGLGEAAEAERFWTLLGSLHFLGGAILCALGMLGEYLGRVYDQVRGRPLYVVKEKSPAVGVIMDEELRRVPHHLDRLKSA